MAHSSLPWQDEAISSACTSRRCTSTSPASPKYFSATLVECENTLLKPNVLFGLDYPVLTPNQWRADFEKINIREEMHPLILKDNVVRLFLLKN